MANPIYAFFHTRAGLGPLCLRLALVATFGYHGSQKAFGLFDGLGFKASLAVMTGSDGLGLPTALATVAIVAELAVAILLFLGLFTRLASLLVILLMTGALIFVHSGSSFGDMELPFVVLAAGISLLFTGGGSLSLDKRLSSALLPEVGYRSLRLT
jgi:putative oxidoreductase